MNDALVNFLDVYFSYISRQCCFLKKLCIYDMFSPMTNWWAGNAKTAFLRLADCERSTTKSMQCCYNCLKSYHVIIMYY